MRKEYKEPEWEMTKFDSRCVITTSTDYDDLGNGDEYDFPGF